MRVRARARQGGVELPLVISDHADWDGLTATIEATGAGEIWVTHGQEDALVHWCQTKGLAARPLDLVGYGDEDEGEGVGGRREHRDMNRFAELLDRLAYEPGRNNKLRLLTRYFREVEDPDRGYALAALTGALSFKHAKPGLIRDLIAERTDPVLFALSYDYVGDLSETVALMWPKAATPPLHNNPPPPTLTEVVTTLRTLGKTELPKQLTRWLDELDETGRWALLKLVTGAMRIGISARLAKTAAAELGDKDPHEIELMWPGLTPPYLDLFAWLEGRADRPVNLDPAPFRPVMLAHAIEDGDFAHLDAAAFIAEWKWDGIRVQAVCGDDGRGHILTRLYSRSGEDITKSFPDLLPSLHLQDSSNLKHDDSRKPLHTFRHHASFAIDGELLVVRDGRVQSFNVLQQRLNRKIVSPKLIKDYPIHLRAYDLLGDGETICARCRSSSAAPGLRLLSAGLTMRELTCRRRSPSTAGTR
jgi:DNA ligase-1